MGLETGNYISDLNPNNPAGSDPISQGDDHDRLVKKCVQQSFPNINGPVNATPAELNHIAGRGLIMPPGIILAYGGATAPNGWLLCDGAAIDAQYTDLIAIVGANTPDLRGQFLRGTSPDNTIDPAGPRAPLSTQTDALQNITGSFNVITSDGGRGLQGTPSGAFSYSNPGNSARDVTGARTQNGTATFDASTVVRTAIETRPKNVAVTYIIKT